MADTPDAPPKWLVTQLTALKAGDPNGYRQDFWVHSFPGSGAPAPIILLAPDPDCADLYADQWQPGGPRGDAGVDLFFPAAHELYRGGGSTMVDLRVRARCWDGRRFVAMDQVPRSSISKTNLTMANAPGTIDAGYQGTIRLPLRVQYVCSDQGPEKVGRGTALSQLRAPGLEPCRVVVVAPDHPAFAAATVRGAGGFGSTGNTAAAQ